MESRAPAMSTLPVLAPRLDSVLVADLHMKVVEVEEREEPEGIIGNDDLDEESESQDEDDECGRHDLEDAPAATIEGQACGPGAAGVPAAPADISAHSHDRALPLVKCYSGHSCALHTHKNSKYFCNYCSQTIIKGSTGLRCGACDFDVCIPCSALRPELSEGPNFGAPARLDLSAITLSSPGRQVVNIRCEYVVHTFDVETCEEMNLSDVKDVDIAPLCENLGRFKRLKKIDLRRSRALSNDGGRAIAQGLKSNCSVVEVQVSARNTLLSAAVRREITQALLEGHSHQGIAVADTCKFFDFETCEEIALSSSSLKDVDIAPLCENLGRFKRLKKINFGGNDLSDEGGYAIAEGLKRNCSVREVVLAENKRLSKDIHREITQIIHCGNGLTKGVASTCKFFDFETCEEMNLSDSGLKDDDLRALWEMIFRFKRLRKIDVSNNHLTDDGGRAIAQGLKSNRSVMEVQLHENEEMSATVRREITQALLEGHSHQGIAVADTCKLFDFETCEEMNLSDAGLKDVGITPLCENLGRFKRLKKINLRRNYLSDDGGRAIAQGLKSNCSVMEVQLHENEEMSATVRREITQALLEGHSHQGIAVADTCKLFDFETCEEMNLSDAGLKDVDITPLCENLGRFKRLKKINLRENDLSDDGGYAIAEGLKRNCSVREVVLAGNKRLSKDIHRDISKGFMEGNGCDTGVAAAFQFFDFETCEEIKINHLTELSDSDLFPVFENLGRFQRLKKIQLTGIDWKWSEYGGREIVEGMKGNCSVLLVDLDSRDLRDDVLQDIEALCQRNLHKPDERQAEVATIKAKYNLLMSSAPAVNYNCSCFYDARLLFDVLKRAADQPLAATEAVKSISMSHNFLTCRAIIELRFLILPCFVNLQFLDISGNPWLGNSGVSDLVSSLAGNVKYLDVSDCRLSGLLSEAIIIRLFHLQKLICVSKTEDSKLNFPPPQVCRGGIIPIREYFYNTKPAYLHKIALFFESMLDRDCPTDLTAAFASDGDVLDYDEGDDDEDCSHDDDDGDDDDDFDNDDDDAEANDDAEADDDDDFDNANVDADDDFEDDDGNHPNYDEIEDFIVRDNIAEPDSASSLKEKSDAVLSGITGKYPSVRSFFNTINALWTPEQDHASPIAQQLWVSLVSHKSSDNYWPLVAAFLDDHIDRVSDMMNWTDRSGRSAAATALALCKNAMSSRCFFMNFYEIPKGLQHEYKSATCTVYLVDRVEGDKRARVALKFMKNYNEFERETSIREKLLKPVSCSSQNPQDCIIEIIDSYSYLYFDSAFRDAMRKRSWLVDYEDPCLVVMPAADRNLRIIMDTERITKPSVIKDLFHQIMNCLLVLHDRGFIHGDVKPRNLMRIRSRLKLIDFDASAKIGRQYSWSKRSSAYMPPEAVCIALSLNSSGLLIVCNSQSAQTYESEVSIVVSMPFDLPSNSRIRFLFNWNCADATVTAVHNVSLDDRKDSVSCTSINSAFIVNDAVVAGDHTFKILVSFGGGLPSNHSVSARVELVVTSVMASGFSESQRAQCIATIRNPRSERNHVAVHNRCMCSCDNVLPTGIRRVDASIPAGCTGLCGLAHVSHDLWALGVILYRFCARASLWSEDDEDNIKDDSGDLLKLALWTDALKEERLLKVSDTATRKLVSRLLEKDPWKRPGSISEVLAIPFNEVDEIKSNLHAALQELGDDRLSRMCGLPVDLVTGRLKDAAFGLRPYLKVDDSWDESTACQLQGMKDEVEALKDCPDCARAQADVMLRHGHQESTLTLQLASALADLKAQRKIKRANCDAAQVVDDLRTKICAAGGWHYGLPNRISWPSEYLKVGFNTFKQPMCQTCKSHCLDYSSISADLHYIMHQAAIEEKFWNGIRDRARAGWRLTDFMALPQAIEAKLTEAELVALRFYTSHSFNCINMPLRNMSSQNPHPLPGVVTNIQRGLKKLRALGSDKAMSKQTVVLWRGMRDRKLLDEFAKDGGTDVSPMSTTTDISVAIKYCVSPAMETRTLLLLRFVTRNNLERGADVQWLSMFPGESETLFPPLTFLQTTSTETQEVEYRGVKVSIVELSTTLA